MIALIAGHRHQSPGGVSSYFTEHGEAMAWVERIALNMGDQCDSYFPGTISDKVQKVNAGSYSLIVDFHFNTNKVKSNRAFVLFNPNSEKSKLKAKEVAQFISNKDFGDFLIRPAWHRNVEENGIDTFLDQCIFTAISIMPFHFDELPLERWKKIKMCENIANYLQQQK